MSPYNIELKKKDATNQNRSYVFGEIDMTIASMQSLLAIDFGHFIQRKIESDRMKFPFVQEMVQKWRNINIEKLHILFTWQDIGAKDRAGRSEYGQLTQLGLEDTMMPVRDCYMTKIRMLRNTIDVIHAARDTLMEDGPVQSFRRRLLGPDVITVRV